MEKKKTFVIAYWLLPTGAGRKIFERQIGELALRFHAAPFAPHVTLCVLDENRIVPLPKIAEIVLDVLGLGESDQFTKTLFLQFEKSSRLENLARSIAAEPVQLDPHLSLLYQNLPAATRRALVQEITLPFREVRFDRVCAMRCALPVASSDDVRSWQLVEGVC